MPQYTERVNSRLFALAKTGQKGDLNRLCLRTKTTQRKLLHQHPALIVIQGLQTDTSHPAVECPGILYPKVVNAPSLCREVGRGGFQTLAHNDRPLPAGTEMVLARID